MAKFTGALFDMDGLLLDTEQIVNQCLKDAARQFGIYDMDDTFLALIGLRGQDSNEMLRTGLADRIELKAFCVEADARIQARVEQGIPVKPGVVALLEQLHERRLPCVVASSTQTDRVDKHLLESGIRHFFATITGGDQVARGKPHPDIYHKAAESVGLCASDCVAFEDSEPGTLAAIAAKATVVQVPDLVSPSTELVKHGHVIANDIWSGAVKVGLLPES